MCGTFCHFAKLSRGRGNDVAPFVPLCFLVLGVNLADILLVVLATFVMYTNECAKERSTAYFCSKESPGDYHLEFCLTSALVSLVSVEGQNPSQLFATVEI